MEDTQTTCKKCNAELDEWGNCEACMVEERTEVEPIFFPGCVAQIYRAARIESLQRAVAEENRKSRVRAEIKATLAAWDALNNPTGAFNTNHIERSY